MICTYMSSEDQFWVHTSHTTTPSPKVTKVVTVTLKSNGRYGLIFHNILDLPLPMYNYCNQISLELVTVYLLH
jgi:hypothetical protein